MKKVVIAGGSGFIGKYLKTKFEQLSYNVIAISRQKGFLNWNETAKIVDALNNSAILINLAGKSVNCRYTKENKQEILISRTSTTKMLGNAIEKCTNPPSLWINAGTATIYRHAQDRPMTENNGELGKGFSVNVAKAWEQAFFDFTLPHTRQVLLRMAIVLGKNEGVLKPLKNLVNFGLGGKHGSGNQMFSWIHIEDLFRIILFLNTHEKLHGIFNCSAPNPVTNKILMQKLRESMNIKVGLPSPKWLLEFGAVFIKTETELVLKSRWVLPEKLLNADYHFNYPEIKMAINDLIK
jgi:uncharacterized protein (TIGR01777 family)